MYQGYTESAAKLEERRRRIAAGTYGRRPATTTKTAPKPEPKKEQVTK